ncbi:hypothetical protein [Roseibium sp.]|uniref:hypothetical protein n=1 Tax=Roseibium sp. TaxID=1936156 RepID=UPI003BAAE699
MMVTIHRLTIISHRTIKNQKPHWYFTGFRYHTKAMAWALSYDPETRRFAARQVAVAALQRGETPFRLTNITAKAKSISAALRSQLSQDDIAFCTRLSITRNMT